MGSIVVKDEKIVGRGIKACDPDGDFTQHAEIEAIRDALKNLNQHNLSDCTLYTTHEPCIMCAYAIRHHAVGKVVTGTRVDAIGGVSSNYPILVAKYIAAWSEPPHIVENVRRQSCEALGKSNLD